MDKVREKRLRREILEKTAEYYRLILRPEQEAPFLPGETGRNFV